MISKIRSVYNEFPSKFWILLMSGFIDRLGGTMIFPFFALYITRKFDVGMTQAGVMLGVHGLAMAISGFFGGALTDKFGRKTMLIFGLVASALSSLAMGLAPTLPSLFVFIVIAGLFANVGQPARQAMVTDMLPEDQRADGFGLMRVVMNTAWVLGPSIGGFLTMRAYIYAFAADAITSIITAVIILLFIAETMTARSPEKENERFIDTLIDYRLVIKDFRLVGFLVASIIMGIVYTQLYSTLSVYLRDVHGLPERGYGALMSINAFTVVLLQLWITRKFKPYPPLLVMALGTGFYAIGFTMYGIVSGFVLFLVAMLIITVGEMIVMPVGHSIVANLAPEDMRGRYMSFYGLGWQIPVIVGPTLAGLVMDNFNPDWVWYGGGILSMVAILGFVMLYNATHQPVTEPALETT